MEESRGDVDCGEVMSDFGFKNICLFRLRPVRAVLVQEFRSFVRFTRFRDTGRCLDIYTLYKTIPRWLLLASGSPPSRRVAADCVLCRAPHPSVECDLASQKLTTGINFCLGLISIGIDDIRG